MPPRAWQLGDPIGPGQLFLPTKADRLAYAEACIAAQIEATARAICAMPDKATRAAAVAMYPADRRDRLKEKIRELWAKR